MPNSRLEGPRIQISTVLDLVEQTPECHVGLVFARKKKRNMARRIGNDFESFSFGRLLDAHVVDLNEPIIHPYMAVQISQTSFELKNGKEMDAKLFLAQKSRTDSTYNSQDPNTFLFSETNE